jgi:competence protein ComEC
MSPLNGSADSGALRHPATNVALHHRKTQAPSRASSPLLMSLALALLAGQGIVGVGFVLPLWALVSGVLLSMALLFFPCLRRPRLALLVMAFGFGNWTSMRVLRPPLAANHVARWATAETYVLEGRLLADPERSERRNHIRLVAEYLGVGKERTSVDGNILLSLRTLEREWLAGDRIRTRLRLRRPRNFGNPVEFDYQGYLARQAIYATAFLADDGSIELLHRPEQWTPLASWRRGFGMVIDRTLSGTERSILRALVIGDAAAVAPPVRQKFTAAGVSHVLSISGLHVGMVAAFGYLGARWLLSRSRWLLLAASVPKLSVLASLLPVLLYAGIAGGSTATLRAVIMAVVFLGAVVVDRRRNLLVSLAFAALIISLLWPASVLDISFQLSFTAVLFLVLTLERFWPWWRGWEERRLVRLRQGWIRWARPIAVYLTVSGAAMVGTVPLTAFHFNQASIVALAANSLVVPILGTGAVAVGLSAALLYPVTTVGAELLVALSWPLLRLGTALVTLFAELPYASVRVVTPSFIEVAIIYGALLVSLCVRGRWRTLGLAVAGFLVLLDAGWWYRERYLGRDLRVTFLSVGQGDATVIECPGGQVLVVDGGGIGDGSFDIGERVIAPYLWSRKIARLDAVILTHPQWDHYGGLAFLTEHFAPGEFWSNGDEPRRSKRFDQLRATIRDSQTRSVITPVGMERACGGAVVRVLGPSGVSESLNDRSLVLQVELGSTAVLLTGDVERAGEAALLAAGRDRLRSAVLKVPHHGSSTSSSPSFVAAVAPRVAIASLGFDNRFGFPHPKTLATYRSAGVSFLRTDLDGAVTLTVAADGHMKIQANGAKR